MESDKQIMAELIPSNRNRIHLIQSVLLILNFQGFLSLLLTTLVYIEYPFKEYMKSNFWILYISAGIYVFLTFTRFIYVKAETTFNQLSLFLIILSCVALDATAAGQSHVVTFMVIVYLFSGILGLFVYSVLAEKLRAWYWGFVITFLAVDLAFAGFCLAGFDVWDSLIFATLGMVYPGFVFLALVNVLERYPIMPKDWASATIFVYFDILVVPFVLTNLWKCRGSS